MIHIQMSHNTIYLAGTSLIIGMHPKEQKTKIDMESKRKKVVHLSNHPSVTLFLFLRKHWSTRTLSVSNTEDMQISSFIWANVNNKRVPKAKRCCRVQQGVKMKNEPLKEHVFIILKKYREKKISHGRVRTCPSKITPPQSKIQLVIVKITEMVSCAFHLKQRRW